jgi:hypothetical protein
MICCDGQVNISTITPPVSFKTDRSDSSET